VYGGGGRLSWIDTTINAMAATAAIKNNQLNASLSNWSWLGKVVVAMGGGRVPGGREVVVVVDVCVCSCM